MLSRKQLADGIALGKSLLAGVGRDGLVVFVTEPSGTAIHVQRPLSAADVVHLPERFSSLPAIDERGPVRVLEGGN